MEIVLIKYLNLNWLRRIAMHFLSSPCLVSGCGFYRRRHKNIGRKKIAFQSFRRHKFSVRSFMRSSCFGLIIAVVPLMGTVWRRNLSRHINNWKNAIYDESLSLVLIFRHINFCHSVISARVLISGVFYITATAIPSRIRLQSKADGAESIWKCLEQTPSLLLQILSNFPKLPSFAIERRSRSSLQTSNYRRNFLVKEKWRLRPS